MTFIPETYANQDWPRKVARAVNTLSRSGFTSRAITGDTDALPSDSALFVDATAAPVTITLPSLGPAILTIKKTDASGNAVTIDGNGANIDGSPTIALNIQYESVTVGGGSEWFIL